MAQKPLRVWIMPSYTGMDPFPFYQQQIEMLEGELGIDIQLRIVSWNRGLEDLVKGFKTMDPPDVFQLGTTWIQTLAYMGYLAPVPTELKTRPALTSWMEQSCQQQGVQIAVPWYVDAAVMVARKDIMDKHGLTRKDVADWDSFLEVCGELSKQGSQTGVDSESPEPLVLPVRPEVGTLHQYMSWLWSGGWDMGDFTSRQSVILDKPEFIETFQYMKRLFDTSGMTKDIFGFHPYMLNERFFLQGLYTFHFGHFYKVVLDQTGGRLSGDSHNFPFEVLPVPAGKAGSVSWGGGAALAVSSMTHYRDEAWEIIKHITGDDFIRSWVPLTGELPAFRCEFWEEYSHHEQLRTIYDQIQNTGFLPPHPLGNSIENIMAKGMGSFLWMIFHEDMSPEDPRVRSILQDTDSSIGKLLKSAWELNRDEPN